MHEKEKEACPLLRMSLCVCTLSGNTPCLLLTKDRWKNERLNLHGNIIYVCVKFVLVVIEIVPILFFFYLTKKNQDQES